MAKAKSTPEVAGGDITQEIEKSGFRKVGTEKRAKKVTLQADQRSERALGVCDRRVQVTVIEQEIKTLVDTFNHELERLNNERRTLLEALDVENDVVVKGEETVVYNCDVWEKDSVLYIVEAGLDVRETGNVLEQRQAEKLPELDGGGFFQNVVPEGVNPV